MTTTTANQGIIIQVGTDPANLPGAQVSQLSVEENRLWQRYTNEADRTARNGAPNENEVSALAAEDRAEIWNTAAWISLRSRANFQTARRATDAANINNSTVLVNDPTLVTVLPAVTGVFKWRDVIYYTSSTAADFKVAYTFGAGVATWGGFGLSTTAVATVGDVQAQVTAGSGNVIAYGGAGVGARLLLVIEGEIALTGAGATLQLQYAQNTADPTNTVPAFTGSYRELWRIS